MANQPYTALSALAAGGIDPLADILSIIDVSAAPGNKSHKVIVNELLTAMLGAYNVSVVELGYLDGVTSAIQAQLNAKQAAALPAVVILTSAASVAVNAALRAPYRLTLGHNVTLQNPTGLADGQVLFFEFIQPGAGGPFTLTLDTKYQWSADLPLPSAILSTGASKIDIMTCIYNATTDKVKVAALTKGF